MDQLQQFIQKSRLYAYIIVVGINFCVIVIWWIGSQFFSLNDILALGILLLAAAILPIIAIHIVSTIFVQPLKFLWQAILYIAPETTNVPAPELHNLKYGKELITNLVNHVYQLADVSKQLAQTAKLDSANLSNNFIANSLPLPLLVLDKNETILFSNNTLLQYIGATSDTIHNKNLYSVLDFSFESDNTFKAWLDDAKQRDVSAVKTWERVKLTLLTDSGKKETRLLDLAAYYNKANPDGYETMLVCFDHTKMYSQDDQAINFVALAVHELRTPLTMLRGYIEALQEELAGKIDDELTGFLKKTEAAAGQLATFVNNILNVAQLEDDRMTLKLQEESWNEVLNNALKDLQLRSKIRGITIKTDIEEELPLVGADRVSLYEVLSNLIDNAIKYSGKSTEILVSAKLTREGQVETTVQDFGVGIPTTAVQHIFDKFYRDHHNRAQIGGTGLGLYLCKNVIKAHGGTVWVKSKVDEGSTFGFTLVPYKDLAEEQKNNNNEGIVRNAHGWVKNHSLYRR